MYGPAVFWYNNNMTDFSSIIKNLDRYKTFTLLDSPKPFSELMKNETVSLVQVHCATLINDNTDIVGFCGVFKWENNVLTPLDGDIYNPDVNVLGYDWFTDKDGNRCLDILVDENW